jgi:hypothetical protein
MHPAITRRSALQRGLAGSAALLGLGDLVFLRALRPVSAAEARLAPEAVRFRPEIEPLVRLIEDTPREKLLEAVAERLRKGLSYREVLAALLLAGVRNVQPRPAVGFKFHAVLVVNSAHLASLSSPPAERWLPIFWALDHFKSAQAQDVREGDWTLSAVNEAAVPPPEKAKAAFLDAMNRWDEPAADAAIAGFVRSAGAAEVFEAFWRLSARDFRSIGHKAIFAANSWRTLQCIGWHHAEPVLRSLAYALLQHEGENPSTRDAPADQPWRRNLELAPKLRPDWQHGRPDGGATAALLDALRTGSEEDAPRAVADAIGGGASAQSVWDAVFLGAGELLMRQPGIVALHAVTSANALHFAYTATASDETRRLLVLQAAAFVALFRKAMTERGSVRSDIAIDRIEPATGNEKDLAPDAIFAAVGSDRDDAARRTLAYLRKYPDPSDLLDAARLLVFLKGNDSHDYKFSSAAFEDYLHVSPPWRERYLAASVYRLRGSAEANNPLVERTRAALGTERRL